MTAPVKENLPTDLAGRGDLADANAILGAVARAIAAGHSGAELDRVALTGAAHGIVKFLLETVREGDQQLIADYALMAIQLVKFLDWIIQNGPKDDKNLELLRSIAQYESFWPTMVRPGDPKFAEQKVDKLSLGAKLIVKPLKKGAIKPPSFDTAHNRLTADLVSRLNYLSQLVAAKEDPEVLIEIFVPELNGDQERIKQVLEILKEIDRARARNAGLTCWGKWLSDFVLISDPNFSRYTELKSVKTGKVSISVKTHRTADRTKLQRFFYEGLKNILR